MDHEHSSAAGAARDDAALWGPLAPSTRRVALEVLRHGPLARTVLARRLGLSTASLTRITKPLVLGGILKEVTDVSTGAGGRPLQPLDLDPGRQHFVGVKLTGDQAHGVLTDLRATISATAECEISTLEPPAVADALEHLVRHLTGPDMGVAAVGIGLGGVVQDFSHVRRAPFLGWRDVDIGRMLANRLHRPVAVANDLSALMEAERWFGDGRDVSQFAVLTIGASVGGGLVIHDRLVTGADAGVGLLGHFPIDPLGPLCPEGHRGCAHSLMSIEAVQSQASLALGRHLSYEDVLDLADAGDRVAVSIVGIAASAFGTLIAAVANIALPERIIITGEGIRLADVGWDRLLASVQASRNPEASALDIRLIPDDPMLWARGAASVAIQRMVLDDLEWSTHARSVRSR
ncbi:ROK family transcriptional regulator [soil metagenome]